MPLIRGAVQLRATRAIHSHVSAAAHAALKRLATERGESINAITERAVLELLRRERADEAAE
jgi:hypothetical protein